MIDKLIDEFRYEFGDNQPDLEEFIRKVLEEQERQLLEMMEVQGQKALEQKERLRLSRERIDEVCIDFVDKHFPKGECQERGSAIVLYAEMLIAICKLQEGSNEN